MQAEQQSERERFEAWCKQENPRYEPTDDSPPNRRDWKVWQARAALSHPSTGQWKPIESAPEGVMLLFANMKAMEARNWCWVGWLAGGHVCGIRMDMPTHWMPLPPPPQGDKT